MKKHFILFVLLGVNFLSCKHDVPVPSTPEISFQRDVQPILIGNCTQSGCHGTVDPEEFTLLTYNDVYENGGLDKDDAEDTKLYRVITEDDDDRMPKEPNAPLSDKQIQTILLWIKQGSKNN